MNLCIHDLVRNLIFASKCAVTVVLNTTFTLATFTLLTCYYLITDLLLSHYLFTAITLMIYYSHITYLLLSYYLFTAIQLLA